MEGIIIRVRRRNVWAVAIVIVSAILLSSYYTREPGTSATFFDETACGGDLPVLSESDKDYLVELAYKGAVDRVEGGRRVTEFPEKYGGICNTVYVLYRVEGRRRNSADSRTDNLAESVYNAGYEAVSRNLCEASLKCYGGIDSEDIGGMQAEVFILDGGEEVWNRHTLQQPSIREEEREYEPGIHTITVSRYGREATYLSDVPVQGNIDAPKVVSNLCNKIGEPGECHQNDDTIILIYDTLHFMRLSRDGETIDVYRGNTLDGYGNLSLGKIQDSLKAMKAWLIDNFQDEGYFRYKYFLGSGEYPESNNMIRQLMASRLLAEMAAEDDGVRAMHEKNLEHVFTRWYREEDGSGYIFFENMSKLGASAMALRVLIYSPLYDEYGEEAGRLANTLVRLQDADGSFDAFLIEPEDEYDEDYYLTFYSGEAVLALTEYYLKTDDPKILKAAVKSQNYYIIKYVDEMDENYYPAYVPWHTISLYKLYRITGDERYVQAIFELNDKLLEIQQIEKPKYVDTWGRFHDTAHIEYGSPHSSSTAVYLEGMTYAYELAKEKGDGERMEKYLESIKLAAQNIMNLQFNERNTYYLNHPERVLGAVRAGVNQNYIRVDTTQHAIDAFNRIVEVVGDDVGGKDVDEIAFKNMGGEG
jgi:hypothetical protein